MTVQPASSKASPMEPTGQWLGRVLTQRLPDYNVLVYTPTDSNFYGIDKFAYVFNDSAATRPTRLQRDRRHYRCQ
ncbi:MAG: hypothetical protein R3C56_08635 [Pirellulaceae bacterium]